MSSSQMTDIRDREDIWKAVLLCVVVIEVKIVKKIILMTTTGPFSLFYVSQTHSFSPLKMIISAEGYFSADIHYWAPE